MESFFISHLLENSKMHHLVCLTFIVLLVDCHLKPDKHSQHNLARSKVDSLKYTHKIRLGESNYFIQLPDTFNIEEARGKEGQLGYNIIPKDTTSTMFGFIEILHGDPIDGDIPERKAGKPYITSNLCDKKVEWKIIKTQTGYFDAFTTEKGDLNSWASSKQLSEVDRLISIISTLQRK